MKMLKTTNRIFKNIIAFLIGTTVAFIIGEIALRVYNPIPFRVKGDKIILPVNKRYTIKNTNIEKLDTLIVHTKNSLGFRGPEKPENFNNYNTFIIVGGSTTECFYLSDNKEWVSLLGDKLSKMFDNIWVNNAGLDGQSTFGHYILLTDYLIKIKPKYILYFVGCNDVGREDLTKHDRSLQDLNLNWKGRLIDNSEFISLAINLYRGFNAKQLQVDHSEINFAELKHAVIDLRAIRDEVEKHKDFVLQYKKRLIKLVKKTTQNNIQPVLITQPTLVGEGMDELTGVNLETVKLMNEKGGKAYWAVLERYNEVTRQVAEQENILFIDLAHKLLKNSNYYYDALHFTNEGAERVSEIIAEELEHHLKMEFR